MEQWSSRSSGLGYDAILEGFSTQRKLNEATKRAVPGVTKGNMTRYLVNRAKFATQKACGTVRVTDETELKKLQPEQTNANFDFVDRKVWSA